jgi:hypothetical protein
MRAMNTGSRKSVSASRTRQLLLPGVLVLFASEALAQADATSPAQPPRTLASLLSEGYEMQEARLFKDKIWMRKPDGRGLIAYICDRGRIGSATFEAYRKGNYDDISCSAAP